MSFRVEGFLPTATHLETFSRNPAVFRSNLECRSFKHHLGLSSCCLHVLSLSSRSLTDRLSSVQAGITGSHDLLTGDRPVINKLSLCSQIGKVNLTIAVELTPITYEWRKCQVAASHVGMQNVQTNGKRFFLFPLSPLCAIFMS